jgi:hypothetical protein
MKRTDILMVDAVINLVLGVLLIFFPPLVVEFLGVPTVDNAFYPSILGGVLFGIGIALCIECVRGEAGLVGLGLGGAISINLCGGVVLGVWLLVGQLSIPLKGRLFLWGLVILLVGISCTEWFVYAKKTRKLEKG